MKQTVISIKEFNELINHWCGKDIKIIKHESNDLDETILLLDQVTYRDNINRIDDYEPRYEIKLTGAGLVETDHNDFEPLPGSVYDIPIDDDSTYKYDGSHFYLSTPRGAYTIQLISPKE